MKDSVLLDMLETMNRYASEAINPKHTKGFRSNCACKAYGMALVLSSVLEYGANGEEEYEQVCKVKHMYYSLDDMK